ncbi:MAG TPA: type II CAAX endopeptidase family protein [Nocardioides sp.]|uniref:CPBP family intramembrane glutamic endopeptidase n=1 Tax=uncultured Nocardioides sp. TaxID=198441 RepID=UPI000EF1165E|nr:type II CAAX endopeptidase family protein [uncultured Nocardioides sp.]HCB07726.1 CPBP family intramembrane metalloprotease [Nocardioides sp.]HRD61806.1 type II CAAX endopeptidase family protein [Nocardioides sp.]HRI95219.1 type II CAAX endopeptidase family protein [Nocardioides sp.]HRK45098.1 type II CAAX endopeptidase family protein [Nocardioides sp.]
MSRFQLWVRRALWDVVPRDHRQEPRELRRRQLVTVGFVVLGAVVLGLSLRIEPGSRWFYPATFGLAAVWVVGAFASGPLHLGRIAVRDRHARPILTPIVIGLGLAAVFVAGAYLVRTVAALDRLEGQVVSIIDYADQGSLPLLIVITAVNGVAEELFFRGAAYAAITRNPVFWTTIAYAVATLATGNVMLSFAALLLGAVVGLERRASGGILAPILTHCTWSLTMLVVLPLVFY